MVSPKADEELKQKVNLLEQRINTDVIAKIAVFQNNQERSDRIQEATSKKVDDFTLKQEIFNDSVIKRLDKADENDKFMIETLLAIKEDLRVQKLATGAIDDKTALASRNVLDGTASKTQDGKDFWTDIKKKLTVALVVGAGGTFFTVLGSGLIMYSKAWVQDTFHVQPASGSTVKVEVGTSQESKSLKPITTGETP